MPCPGILALPANIFPIKLAANVPNNLPGNRPLFCFTSFYIVLLTSFINKLNSSISSFEIINLVMPEP